MLDQMELYSRITLRGRNVTDAEFLRFCAAHEDLRVESNADGEVELMPGTGPETGDRNAEIAYQLRAWTKRDLRGASFDSSTLFVLPSGARRSPDASWIAKDRIATIPPEQRSHLWRLCPEFVIELRSPSDRPPELHAKLVEWLANGTQLGWLIDPEERSVTIYRAGFRAGEDTPEILMHPATIEGEGPVLGFSLDLTEIWAASRY